MTKLYEDSRKDEYIGVFDSGLGGISTLIDLKKVLPNENFYYFGDSQNAPYGPKKPDEILALCLNIAELLYNKKVKAIVVACNTATSVAIDTLREKYKDIPIIGVEPAVKLGVKSGGKNILVMATETTIRESKFQHLIKDFKNICNINTIACPELVQLVENDELNNSNLCKATLEKYFSHFDMNKIDTIVLGCTHFIFYKDYIKELLGDKQLIVDGNLGTALHLQNLLKKNNLLSNNNDIGNIEFMNSQIILDNTVVSKKDLSEKLFIGFSK